ncbi:unnamed protein product [Owenia fusiformis]|uniref:Uncharacterized protein n=1 Tax=Owenia fusiformis TaxID=6347 RepID=A0A8S4Q4W2_OWEFU|nr:unnamed protein product [Owenia fusiformis]
MSAERGQPDEATVTSNAAENDKENVPLGAEQGTVIDVKQGANISDELLACAPVLMDTWEAKKPVKRNPPSTTATPAAKTEPATNEIVKESAGTPSKPDDDVEPLKPSDKAEEPVQNGEVNGKHVEPIRPPEELTPDAISERKEARIKSLETQIKLQREKARLSCQRLEQATKLLDMRRKALEEAERKAREAERRIMAMETVLEKTKDPNYEDTFVPKDKERRVLKTQRVLISSTGDMEQWLADPNALKKAKETELRQICGDMKSIETRSSSAKQSTEALEQKMNHLRAEIDKWKGRRDELKDMRDEQKALLAEIPKLSRPNDDTDQPPPPSAGSTE